MAKYDELQKNLLPAGFAWIRKLGKNLLKLLGARSPGYQAVDDRTIDLIDEVIPSTTRELLPEWESVCGLPDPLLIEDLEEDETEAQRRNAVLSKLVASGNLSKAFLIQVAKNYGYEIQIEEFFQDGYSSLCGTALCGSALCGGNQGWLFAFNVISDDEFAVFARCGTALCGDRIAEYGDTKLQVIMKRHKPAHTVDLYNFGI